jgi:hypothetical protein
VTTRDECSWRVSGVPGWITATPSTKAGSGTVVVAVSANSGSARSAVFQIAEQNFTVNQLGSTCTYSISPKAFDVSRDTQTANINVSTQAGCPVDASPDVSWLSIVSAPTSGSGMVIVSIDRNNERSSRTGTVTITGNNFKDSVTITQQGRD